MRRKILSVIVVLALIITLIPMSGAVAAEQTISVKLVNYLGNQSQVNISYVGTYLVQNDSNIKLAPNTTYTVKAENGHVVLYQGAQQIKDFGTSLTLAPVKYGEESIITINGRKYLGTMEFRVEGGQYIRPVNQNIPFEDYLKGVVPREMPASWNLEALKAQAIAARTYAIDDVGQTVADGQSYQVYGGYYWDPRTNEAVESTRTQVLKYDGKLVEAYFSSSNGGKVLSNTNAWGSTRLDYLVTKEDTFDAAATSNPYRTWSFDLYKTQIDMNGKDLTKPEEWWGSIQEKQLDRMNNIKAWMKKYDSSIPADAEIKIIGIPSIWFTTSFNQDDTLMGKITIEYYLKTQTGFVKDVNGEILKNSVTYTKKSYDIRSMIGSTLMRSPYIKSIETKVDSQGKAYFRVNGGGWGHGIGMSQYGANVMASQGKNYREILSFYYPGSKIFSSINTPVRLAGKDRFETANKISQKGWSTADTVVLAFYNNHADALAAAPLAYKVNGPILLTESKSLTPVTKTEIQRLKAKNAIIVGGTGVISINVENQLKQMGLNVLRYGGVDRFDTANRIARQLGTTDTAVIAYGLNFPDALAIAPYAAAKGYPILLVDKTKIPSKTVEALKTMNIKKTIIIGGSGVVSDSVLKQLPTPRRIAGIDRFSTATEVIRQLDLSTDLVYVATGMDYADALTGAVLAAKDNAPLLLTFPNELPDVTRRVVIEKNILNFTILGGTGAVSDKIKTALVN
ncbi:SpoIID/LytB domain-containing protein [Tepidibacillus fermentans]|uniref:SpoIID/LytB domain protein n=1 Tax=Tepidibacillus fermentans TaxID=1281767 RepID=A0A4R3KJ36_9BACI|nr:SpoIID/LytB domain-containing protein [Tepidibacillus fermentans]TCS83347.1 SpoIID/LytB domain protein [Tepidibacillus fermentans]